MNQNEDGHYDEGGFWIRSWAAPDSERRMREGNFRKGACHAVAGAERIAVWYGTSATTIIEALQIYGQVIDDWRCGLTENEGFSDNPWTWEREVYEAYVKMQQPKW